MYRVRSYHQSGPLEGAPLFTYQCKTLDKAREKLQELDKLNTNPAFPPVIQVFRESAQNPGVYDWFCLEWAFTLKNSE